MFVAASPPRPLRTSRSIPETDHTAARSYVVASISRQLQWHVIITSRQKLHPFDALYDAEQKDTILLCIHICSHEYPVVPRQTFMVNNMPYVAN
jgi:hypothetical protein